MAGLLRVQEAVPGAPASKPYYLGLWSLGVLGHCGLGIVGMWVLWVLWALWVLCGHCGHCGLAGTVGLLMPMACVAICCDELLQSTSKYFEISLILLVFDIRMDIRMMCFGRYSSGYSMFLFNAPKMYNTYIV